MKAKLILLLFIVVSLKSFSQSKNILSFQYGTSSNVLRLLGRHSGGIDIDGTSSNLFGLKYTRNLNSTLSISSGVQISDDELHLDGTIPPYDKEAIKLVSIPVYVNVNFLKYLFIDGGFTFDFQTNKNQEAQTQSGVGLELGAGAKYNFGPIQVFVNPYLQEHAAFKQNQRRLLNDGYKFGIGYCF